MFVHVSVAHLCLNMLLLAVFGMLVERAVGSLRFTTIYYAAGLGGAALHALVDPTAVVGASGCVFRNSRRSGDGEPARSRLRRGPPRCPSRVDRRTRERAAEMKEAGKTIREIARALKVPRSTIARALANPL